jgi:hypothetical protein
VQEASAVQEAHIEVLAVQAAVEAALVVQVMVPVVLALVVQVMARVVQAIAEGLWVRVVRVCRLHLLTDITTVVPARRHLHAETDTEAAVAVSFPLL